MKETTKPRSNHLKVGDKVRIAYRFDRMIVREIRESRFEGFPRTISCDFESGFGWYTGPEHEFTKGWKPKVQ